MITRVQKIDQLVAALGILDQLDHQVRRAAHEAGRAERAARGDHRQDVAVVENPLPDHLDAVQRERGEGIGFDFVFGKLIDVFEPIERVIFARRVVLPEFDFRPEHRWLGRHAVFHPPTGDEDDVGKLPHDLQVRLEPQLGIQVVVHVLDSQIAGNPGTIDDQRHRHLVELFETSGALKDFPLMGEHGRAL